MLTVLLRRAIRRVHWGVGPAGQSLLFWQQGSRAAGQHAAKGLGFCRASTAKGIAPQPLQCPDGLRPRRWHEVQANSEAVKGWMPPNLR